MESKRNLLALMVRLLPLSWDCSYLSGSALTKLGSKQKQKYEESYVQGGQRNWIQVLSNGLTGAILCILHQRLVLTSDPCSPINTNLNNWILFSGYIAHFGCWYILNIVILVMEILGRVK